MVTWRPGVRESLDPEFADDIDTCVGPLPDEYIAESGGRTLEQEGVNYAKGRALQPDGTWIVVDPDALVSWALPRHSAHVDHSPICKPCALDFSRNGTYDFTSDPAWPRLWVALEQFPTTHSGHDFPPGETDNPHAEAYRWAHHTSAGPSYVAQLQSAGEW